MQWYYRAARWVTAFPFPLTALSSVSLVVAGIHFSFAMATKPRAIKPTIRAGQQSKTQSGQGRTHDNNNNRRGRATKQRSKSLSSIFTPQTKDTTV